MFFFHRSALCIWPSWREAGFYCCGGWLDSTWCSGSMTVHFSQKGLIAQVKTCLLFCNILPGTMIQRKNKHVGYCSLESLPEKVLQILFLRVLSSTQKKTSSCRLWSSQLQQIFFTRGHRWKYCCERMSIIFVAVKCITFRISKNKFIWLWVIRDDKFEDQPTYMYISNCRHIHL